MNQKFDANELITLKIVKNSQFMPRKMKSSDYSTQKNIIWN